MTKAKSNGELMSEGIREARWLAMLALTGIGLYLCWLMLKPFAGVLEWAIVLVIVFHPIHKHLVRTTGRQGLSAFLSCVLVVLVFLLPAAVVMMAVADEITRVLPGLRSNLTHEVNGSTFLGQTAQWLQDHVGIDMVRSQEFLVIQIKHFAESVVGFSWNLVSNIASFIAKSFFVVFTMYYLFKDTDSILNKLPSVLPVSADQSEAIIRRTQEVVSASVYGVVAIASMQGLLGGFAFWLVGIPSPILWAVLMTFVCMIPIAGSFLVWLPLSFYLIARGHWTSGIILILWGTFVISLVDNFLRPKLIREQTKLHELFVFFSVLGGIGVFGLLGIVLGPVILAITIGLLQTFKHPEALPAE